jgi:hypothetical protein
MNWNGQPGGRRIGRAAVTLVCTMALVASLISCVTGFRPAPEGENDMLLVGAYWFEEGLSLAEVLGQGWGTADVRLLMQETNTGQRVRAVRHGGRGLLVGSGIRAGVYEVHALEIDVAYSGRKVGELELGFRDHPTLTLSAGRVWNFGMFELTVHEDHSVSYRWLSDFDRVEQLFRDSYPDSEWNSYRWQSAPLRY